MEYPAYFSTFPNPYTFGGALPPTPAHTQLGTSDDPYTSGSPDGIKQQNGSIAPQFDHSSFVADQSLHKPEYPDLLGAIAGTGDNEQGGRDSSEEKESVVPAQSRRKAQNRAAQRAFRERKERHVKDLEQKLTALETTSSSLAADNERLKQELQKISTENEILRATASSTRASSRDDAPPDVVGPMRYTPSEFYNTVLEGHGDKPPSHRISVSPRTGEKLLGASATWDLIQEHPLAKRGLVDVAGVSERLKTAAICDGQGPAFEEREIINAIEECAVAGDSLI